MKLSVRPLINVASVNSFDYSQQIEFTTGDITTLYFQLVDLDKDKTLNPIGKRYIPAAGATLAITFLNINDANQFTRSATQPYSQDASIWSVPILATDPITGTVDIRGTLTENGLGRTFMVHAAVEVGV